MPNIPKVLYRGSASAVSSTLYTVPSSTTAVVTNIVVANSASSTIRFNIGIDGFNFIPSTNLSANSVATFDVKQVLVTTDFITGTASSAGITFHISGMEIT